MKHLAIFHLLAITWVAWSPEAGAASCVPGVLPESDNVLTLVTPFEAVSGKHLHLSDGTGLSDSTREGLDPNVVIFSRENGYGPMTTLQLEEVAWGKLGLSRGDCGGLFSSEDHREAAPVIDHSVDIQTVSAVPEVRETLLLGVGALLLFYRRRSASF